MYVPCIHSKPIFIRILPGSRGDDQKAEIITGFYSESWVRDIRETMPQQLERGDESIGWSKN
jgi:hypothetical protein